MRTIKLLGMIAVLLIITSITLSNHSLEYSGVVTDLSSDITSLKHANVILNAEIAERGSLLRATQNLSGQDYLEPETVSTLAEPGKIALR